MRVLVLVFLLGSVPAWGATRYVHPSGSSGNTPCTNAGAPCNLSTAIAQALTGDVILFQNSTAHAWAKSDTVRSGVTFRGETPCTVTSRDTDGYPVNISCPVRWRCGTSGSPCLNIRHNSTVVEHLEIDGQNTREAFIIPSGGTNSVIQFNYLHNVIKAGISVCGDNACNNITIRGNVIRDTGMSGPGEAVYIGSATSLDVNFVTNVLIYGNFFQRFTSNGIDCKRNSGSDTQNGCVVNHNVFTGQLYRPFPQKCNSEGTLLSSGSGSRWLRNIIKDSGTDSTVGDCNPVGEHGWDVGVVLTAHRGARREIRAEGNVISNIFGAVEMMSTWTSGENAVNFALSPPTVFTGNYFCNNGTYAVDVVSPHIVTANTGIPGGAPQSTCDAQEALVFNEMAALTGLRDGFPFEFGDETPPLPTPEFVSCSVAAGTTMDCTVDAKGSTPMLPATGITGFTARKNGVAWTVSSAARTGSEQITLTLTPAAGSSDVLDVTYTRSTGNLTNTAGTEIAAITNFSVANNIAPTPTFTGLATWQVYPANCVLGTAHCRPLAPALTLSNRAFRNDAAFQVAMPIDVTGAQAMNQGYGVRCQVNAGPFFQVTPGTTPVRIGINTALAVHEPCSGIQSATYCFHLHTNSGVSVPVAVAAGERYSLVPTLQFVTSGLTAGDTVTCQPTEAAGTPMTSTNPFVVTIGTAANSVIYSSD